MYCKHINNVVLYAKNWYKQSDDLISDLITMCKLDNPSLEINSPEELQQIMWKNYDIWRDLNETNTTKYEDPETRCVAWADGIEGNLHSILIAYKCYIDDLFGNLTPPHYTKDILPELKLRLYNPFVNCETIDDYNKAARKHFEKTKDQAFKEAYIDVLRRIDFEEFAKELKLIGDNTTIHALKHELSIIYKEARSKIYNGVYPVSSKNFKSKHYNVCVDYKSIEMNVFLVLGRYTFNIDYNQTHKNDNYEYMVNKAFAEIDKFNLNVDNSLLEHLETYENREILKDIDASQYFINNMKEFIEEEISESVNHSDCVSGLCTSGCYTGHLGLEIHTDKKLGYVITFSIITSWNSSCREKMLYTL